MAKNERHVIADPDADWNGHRPNASQARS